MIHLLPLIILSTVAIVGFIMAAIFFIGMSILGGKDVAFIGMIVLFTIIGAIIAWSICQLYHISVPFPHLHISFS